MYEGLLSTLREYAEWADENIYEVPIMLPDTLKKAADAIEELSREIDIDNATMTAMDAAMPRWIPVTEWLPEDLTRVIVFCEDGVSYGLCEHLIADDEEVVEWHDFLHYPITPTHWMPLPEPPKEET